VFLIYCARAEAKIKVGPRGSFLDLKDFDAILRCFGARVAVMFTQHIVFWLVFNGIRIPQLPVASFYNSKATNSERSLIRIG
jgi:hypothetical protein